MRYNVFLKIALFEIMWKNIIESHKSQIWIRRMRFACWITKTTEGRSEYLILIAFLRQQWLRVIRTLSCLYELFVNRVMAFACNKCVCFVGVGRTWNEGSMTVWTTEKSSVIPTEHGMRGVWRCGQRRKAPSSLPNMEWGEYDGVDNGEKLRHPYDRRASFRGFCVFAPRLRSSPNVETNPLILRNVTAHKAITWFP